MAIDCVGSPTGISTAARAAKGANRKITPIAAQNTERAASTAERTPRRSLDVVEREIVRARFRIGASLPMATSNKNKNDEPSANGAHHARSSPPKRGGL